ncbi:MAG TPA: hypothetical protein VHJ17_18570, partial [Thermomonospora sp.]|nr:hypothetical protein [Thermomonospora sp.]
MADVLPLLAGTAAIAAALALAVWPARRPRRRTGVAGALHAIETDYAGRAPGSGAPASRDERLAEPLMRRLRMLAGSLSPRTDTAALQRRLDVAGNPGSWTPERILS